MGENDFFGNSQGSDGSSVGGGDSYVEETTTGWSSRIAGSFAGILVGIVFVVGAFVLLFWNEGRTIKTTRALQEAGRVFVALDRPVVDPANNGKLVYATGDASADEILSDKTFGISSKVIRLQRLVETYQWKEHEKSETTKNVGGSTTTRKTYTYEKTWSDSIIDSYAFKKPEGHMNPTQVALSRQDIWAKQVHFGGFSLPRSLLQQLDNFEPVAIDASVLGSLPAPYKDKAQIVDEWCYLGKANEPTIGDQRIKFRAIKPGPVSVMARQRGAAFEPYTAQSGKQVEIIRAGIHSPDGMLEQAQSENNLIAWLMRRRNPPDGSGNLPGFQTHRGCARFPPLSRKYCRSGHRYFFVHPWYGPVTVSGLRSLVQLPPCSFSVPPDCMRAAGLSGFKEKEMEITCNPIPLGEIKRVFIWTGSASTSHWSSPSVDTPISCISAETELTALLAMEMLGSL